MPATSTRRPKRIARATAWNSVSKERRDNVDLVLTERRRSSGVLRLRLPGPALDALAAERLAGQTRHRAEQARQFHRHDELCRRGGPDLLQGVQVLQAHRVGVQSPGHLTAPV